MEKIDIPNRIFRIEENSVEFVCECENIQNDVISYDGLHFTKCDICNKKYAFVIPPFDYWMYNKWENYKNVKYVRDRKL